MAFIICNPRIVPRPEIDSFQLLLYHILLILTSKILFF